MQSFNFELARLYAEKRLERELSPYLLYHAISHTRDEVVPAVEMLARMAGVRDESLLLLLTAAWFHDLGYTETTSGHEMVGFQIAKDVLPIFGYSPSHLEVIQGCLLATILPQSPKNLLEQIMADADLDVLGRENFIQRNRDLRAEMAYLGREFDDEQWYMEQLQFIRAHTYFTEYARSMRDAQKKINIELLQRLLGSVTQNR